jgi:hypothetical protein
MRAVLRVGFAIAVAGLALGPVAALAQSTPETTTSAPATDAIGPRELQNFSLPGTVTRQSEQPAATAPAAAPDETTATNQSASKGAAPQRRQERTNATAASQSVGDAPPAATGATAVESAPLPQSRAQAQAQPAPSSSVTVPLPPPNKRTYASLASDEPGFAPEPGGSSRHSFPLIPWLLAAIALGAGGAFMFWRNRARHAFAGGPQVDAFMAPEPAPRPAPPRARQVPPPAAPPRAVAAPAPAPAPVPAKPVGVVSARLRPSIDVTFQPTRCILDEQNVTIEFELELFNSGSGPARDVLIEATVFNAGPAQDQEILAFFAAPVGQGERIAAIPPLKRLNLRTQVAVPRSRLQLFEIGGRQVFVPLIAFNALYNWGTSAGQTSLSFLIGREGKGEKLAPFRIDLGPRVFRGLGARPLPQSLRN